jgi:hypothetical protein
MPRRLYIYRNGASGYCAVTAKKKDVNLPATAGANEWRFWMQIGPVQAQNGRLGFDVSTAITALVRDGFHLFTGSSTLLGDCRPVERPVHKGPTHAR